MFQQKRVLLIWSWKFVRIYILNFFDVLLFIRLVQTKANKVIKKIQNKELQSIHRIYLWTAEALSMASSDKLLWQKVTIYKPLFLKEKEQLKSALKFSKLKFFTTHLEKMECPFKAKIINLDNTCQKSICNFIIASSTKKYPPCLFKQGNNLLYATECKVRFIFLILEL